MEEKPITRIDIEQKDGGGILVMFYTEGWVEGQSSPAQYDFQPTETIVGKLQEYERLGYTVEMCDAFHGRALRGRITRIDFMLEAGTWKIKKFPYGWTAKTKPISVTLSNQDEISAALDWCKVHRWTIRTWPNGARAWRGEAMPVRSTSDIRYLRRQIDRGHEAGKADDRAHYDLAFDY